MKVFENLRTRDNAQRTIASQWYTYTLRIAFIEFINARRIQSWWRGREMRTIYVEFVNARRIQSWWRCLEMRTTYIEYISACKIQAWWRCLEMRTTYIEYISARKIQAWLRCQSLHHLYKEYLSAIKIQSWIRGTFARHTYRKESSARKIQTFCRAKMMRQSYVEFLCARKIQTYFRRWTLQSLYTEYLAARRVQACYRMFSKRKEYLTFKNARTLQAWIRMILIRLQYKEYISARMIQSLFRGYAMKIAYRDFRSARTIQNTWREYSTNKIEKNACITIQKVWRGFYQFSLYSITQFENDAATTIQRHWRGFWQYSHYVILQYEVTKIQSLIRGVQVRSRMGELSHNMTIIQKGARRCLAQKQLYDKMIESALTRSKALSLRNNFACRKIQRWWLRRVQIKKEKEAALVIERFFIWVRAEVEREILRCKIKRAAKKQKRKVKKFSDDESSFAHESQITPVKDSHDKLSRSKSYRSTYKEAPDAFNPLRRSVSSHSHSTQDRFNPNEGNNSSNLNKVNGRSNPFQTIERANSYQRNNKFNSFRGNDQSRLNSQDPRSSSTPRKERSHSNQRSRFANLTVSSSKNKNHNQFPSNSYGGSRLLNDSKKDSEQNFKSNIRSSTNSITKQSPKKSIYNKHKAGSPVKTYQKRFSFYDPNEVAAPTPTIDADSQSEVSGLTAPSYFARPLHIPSRSKRNYAKNHSDEDLCLEEAWKNTESDRILHETVACVDKNHKSQKKSSNRQSKNYKTSQSFSIDHDCVLEDAWNDTKVKSKVIRGSPKKSRNDIHFIWKLIFL